MWRFSNWILFYRSNVRIVSSCRSGMGKSLYIQHLADELKKKYPLSDVVHVIIPLHGPVVTPDTLLELFKDHFQQPTCCIYHIDIAPNVRSNIVDNWGEGEGGDCGSNGEHHIPEASRSSSLVLWFYMEHFQFRQEKLTFLGVQSWK